MIEIPFLNHFLYEFSISNASEIHVKFGFECFMDNCFWQ